MDAEPEAVQIGKLRQLPSGEWYVHCRWCEKEARFQARNEDEAYGMLDEWRLAMPRRHSKFRNWSCPSCRGYWTEPEPTTADAAGSAATDTAGSADATATSLDVLKLEVQQLKAEVVELKAEVIELKAEVHGHVVYKAAKNNEILERALQMVRREVRKVQKRRPADIPVSDDDESLLQEC